MTALLVPMHGIGSRKDLPLPFELVLLGAAVVLVATFAVALWAWRAPRLEQPRGRALPGLTRLLDLPAVRTVLALLVWAVTLWFWAALWFGVDRLSNPAFGWVFACLWVGLVPVSLLLGGAWRRLHPLWTLATALRWRGLRPLPERVGTWPAALGLVGFAWFELVQPGRATLPVLQGWALAWLAWVALGVVLFGRAWVPAADPFTAYADLVARLSPWQRIDGTLHLVSPLRHLATEPVGPGVTAVGCVLLGATAFDSFSGGSWWIRTMQGLHADPVLASTLGLVAFVALVSALVVLGMAATRPWTDGRRWPARLGATLAPLAAGYAIGHYATLLAVEGQRTLIQASDPLGRGWNAFGTAELGVNMAFAQAPTVVAVVQLVSIVGGHVLGVLAAHEESLRVLRPRGRVLGQLGMLVVMVAITVAGLTLLFAA